MAGRLTKWSAALLCASVSVLAGSGVAAARVGSATGHGAAPLVVRTDKGLVRGAGNGEAREFLGIPYAAPPVGPLRWRPPQPAARWRGIRDASMPGSVCAQNGSIATGVRVTSVAEDCLYLNVYAPSAASSRPRPVMVWIHGGGFTGGAGSIFDGAPLAVTGNAVIVTVNYRLGPFGFLALPSLGPDSGDYGLLDQQAALRWVQRNASAFGGNPHDVTIFGESAGGASACDNMTSPTASGLFERAIAESICLQPGQDQQQAERAGASFAARLGCPDAATAAACLRAKPVTALLAASGSVPGGWAPVVGGQTLPVQPATAFATGRYAHVPLLQGTNLDDERLSVGFEFGVLGPPMTAAQYPGLLTSQFGAADAAKIEARYPLSAYPSPGLAYASVQTDSQSSCPALATDRLVSRSGVYAYEFSDPNPPNDFGIALGIKFSFPLGDAHSTELQYVFGKIPTLDTMPPFTVAQFTLSAQMMKYWSRFAVTGNPNGGGTASWPAFRPDRQRIEELTSTGTAPTSGFAASHQCALWSSIER